MKSYGGDDRPRGARGFVRINGIQVTQNHDIRGFRLVRLDDDCSVKEKKTFDTHFSIQESRKMTDYLKSLPYNTRIAGIASTTQNLSSSLKSELRVIGLNMTSASWRSAHCFTFTIGKPQYTKQSQVKKGRNHQIYLQFYNLFELLEISIILI